MLTKNAFKFKEGRNFKRNTNLLGKEIQGWEIIVSKKVLLDLEKRANANNRLKEIAEIEAVKNHERLKNSLKAKEELNQKLSKEIKALKDELRELRATTEESYLINKLKKEETQNRSYEELLNDFREVGKIYSLNLDDLSQRTKRLRAMEKLGCKKCS